MPEFFIMENSGKSAQDFFKNTPNFSGSHDKTVDLVDSCRLQLAYTPPSWAPYLVTVAIDCEPVPRDEPPMSGAGGVGQGTAENWTIDDSTSPPTLEFLGDYCERVRRGVDRVDIVVGCPLLCC